MDNVSMLDNGTLGCSFYRLVKLLGEPRRSDPKDGDGKVRVTWKQFVPDLGIVEIYDYKRSDVPVEMVGAWSINAEPAVKTMLVQRLAELEILEDDVEEFCVDDLFEVVEWISQPCGSGPTATDLHSFGSQVDWDEWDEKMESEAMVGLVRHFLVVRSEGAMELNVWVYDTRTMKRVETRCVC